MDRGTPARPAAKLSGRITRPSWAEVFPATRAELRRDGPRLNRTQCARPIPRWQWRAVLRRGEESLRRARGATDEPSGRGEAIVDERRALIARMPNFERLGVVIHDPVVRDIVSLKRATLRDPVVAR